MSKVTINDTLFLTLMQRGTMVFNRRVDGIRSRTDLLNFVRDLMKGCQGMVTMTLRNRTQGWVHTDSLLLTAC